MDNMNVSIFDKVFKSNILHINYYNDVRYTEGITNINILYKRTYLYRNNIAISYRYRLRYE